jgi:hypothetical protein
LHQYVRKAGVLIAFVVGLFFIGRAVAEVALLDYGHPESYRLDWGGPSLVGVLAVHCGPGVIAVALMAWWLRRRVNRRARRAKVVDIP